MCTTHVKKVSIEAPRTVYKVILHKLNKNEVGAEYVSPFYKKKLTRNIINGYTAYKVDKSGNLNSNWEYGVHAAEGFVHAYENIESAAKDFGFYLSTCMRANPGYAPELWECEVLAEGNEECYIGGFDCQLDLRCIAVKKMYFRKRIEYGAIAAFRRTLGMQMYVKEERIISKIEETKTSSKN